MSFRRTRIVLAFFALFPVHRVLAQVPDTSMAGMVMGGPTNAPLGISMDRIGSGTTWLPDAVSVPARHFMRGAWELMVHGFIFAQYNTQRGPRGDDQFGSLNWGMFMASRELAGGRFQVRTMLSLDPATVTKRGYPLLLQTGEVLDGQPIRDRQHPHDFWMEVAAAYERTLTSSLGLSVYAAPSGEPALGPVAFMHRPSAMDNPFAPLGHHWQDATHIAFGVVTAGVFGRTWKIEGSIFNGREPDEERWNIERIRLDSYSARLTLNPGRNWSISVGHGYFAGAEAGPVDHDDHHGAIVPHHASMHRLTAAVLHGAALGTDGQWASAVIYGANTTSDHKHSQSVAFESEAILDRWNTILARAELAQKSAEEMSLDDPPFNIANERRFNVGALSLGYIRELGRGWGTTIGLGAMGTMNFVPDELAPAYGSRTPLGAVVFLRVRPFHTARGGMEGMHHGNDRP